MANQFWVDVTFIPKEGEIQTESTYTPKEEEIIPVSFADETSVDIKSVEIEE
jgi:hypothetical protein